MTREPINIVPLKVPQGTEPAAKAIPATPPNLAYGGGPLIQQVSVFTIFWGDDWRASQSDLATQINAFFGDILSSSLIDQLAEYNVTGQSIQHGSLAGTVTLPSGKMRSTIADGHLQRALQGWIADGTVPKPGPNILYFVYLPPGLTVEQGRAKSCTAFCGYHDAIGSQIFYAVMPFPNCDGCLGGMTPLDALTTTSSHELCEAITDPIPGQGWYDQNNGEIGDICAWTTKAIGKWTVQKEWSNNSGSCV